MSLRYPDASLFTVIWADRHTVCIVVASVKSLLILTRHSVAPKYFSVVTGCPTHLEIYWNYFSSWKSTRNLQNLLEILF